MKVLLLSGIEFDERLEGYEELVISAAKKNGFEIEHVLIRNYSLQDCLGCLNCWFVTPGQCVLKDCGAEILRKIHETDLLIMLSPVTFGGYSSCLKKMIDRVVPLALPHIIWMKGRECHKKRYKKTPNILGIGITSNSNDEEGELFKSLVKMNAINLRSEISNSILIKKEDKLEEADRLLNEAFQCITAQSR